MKSISDIKHAFYINLASRVDRKKQVEEQLFNVGLTCAQRFEAIKLDDGRVGCSMSHLKCLSKAKEGNWDHVLICEDDIEFLNPGLFINQLNTFLSKHNNWDVVLLAGNNVPPYTRDGDECVKVARCQTTTGYLVNGHYFNTLIENIKNGITNLLREPGKHIHYAIDRYWFSLQQKDDWYLLTPLSVVQRPGYSDIEKRVTNFVKAMTDLDKKELVEAYMKRLEEAASKQA
jgi:GR25 family glycosyltransferase involved in LPS biosynthesis